MYALIYWDDLTPPTYITRTQYDLLWDAIKDFLHTHHFVMEHTEWKGNCIEVYCY